MSSNAVPRRKPDSDTREYRLVQLPNKLDVILVSDPETQTAAAAVSVSAGQLQDPTEVQGLAHFCEHMLFLGSQKFPDESDFDSFCAQSAGYSNAWTSMDRTVYHFMLAHNQLYGALDKFSGFFTSPLFTEDLTERELNAVDSENNKNLQEDARREYQLWRSTAKKGHSVQRFGTGNKQTLWDTPIANGTNTRKHLMDFYNGCYSANIMKVAVLGREDLDTLEKWVRELFSDVPNHDISPLQGVSPTDNAFDYGWKQLYRIVPVKERRKLVLYFPTASTYPSYRMKPTRFISHCMGHEGPGSILSLLKKLGWATDLGAGTSSQSTYFALFEISIKLTEEGLSHYMEVIDVVFSYIRNCLRASSDEARQAIRSECEMIEELNFRFRSKQREDAYTEQLAVNLSRYPREEVLCGAELFYDPLDMRLVDKMLDEDFTPANLRIDLVAPLAELAAQVPSDAVWEAEEWYGTKYHRTALSAAIQTRWTSLPPHADLMLPKLNQYTPEKNDLKGPQEAAPLEPVKVIDTAKVQAYHVMDCSFGVPKAACHLQLTNFAVERSPRTAVCLRMVLELVQEVTNEEAYDAEEAGLIFDITNSSQSSPCCGLRLSFKGYDHKMAFMVKNIVKCIAEFDIAEHLSTFELLKEKTIVDYRNRKFQQSYVHAITANNAVQEKPFWSNEERLTELETLTADEVQRFLTDFLSQLLIEGMMVGNMTAEEAVVLVNSALEHLSHDELAPGNVPALKTTKVPDGVTVLHEELNPDPDAVDSSISVYVQVGERSVVQDVTLELLCQIMDKDMYSVLRTQEQLGYVVAGVASNKWQVGGVRFLIQGVMDPEYLEGRLENFLHLFQDKLATMAPEDFSEHVQSLITKKSEKDRNCDRHCDRLMQELCSHTYLWNRKDLEVKALAEITQPELVEFFVKYLSVTSQTRRRIACHVVGRAALDVLKGAGVEPSVTDASKGKLLVFAPGAVPFPLPPADGAAPPALPEPSFSTISAYKKASADFAVQK